MDLMAPNRVHIFFLDGDDDDTVDNDILELEHDASFQSLGSKIPNPRPAVVEDNAGKT